MSHIQECRPDMASTLPGIVFKYTSIRAVCIFTKKNDEKLLTLSKVAGTNWIGVSVRFPNQPDKFFLGFAGCFNKQRFIKQSYDSNKILS